MPTPAEIAEQIAHERDAIRCGVEKLMKNTRTSEEREYASSSVYGTASISEAQSHIADEIMKTFEYQIIRGKNGVAYAEIAKHLKQFNNPEDANILANIALKRTFDLVFSQKRKDSKKHPNAVGNVAVSVGASVEHECQIRWYEQQDPDLLKKVQKFYWKSTTGTDQKLSVTRLMFNREDIKWDTWSAPLRGRLGGWLVGIVCDVTGWFEKKVTMEGKPRISLLVPTEKYLAIQEQIMEQAVLFAPMSWAMLTEPNDWTNEKKGGYYLNELMMSDQLVRRGDNTIIQPETVLNFVNKLQKVEYTLNRFVLQVAKTLDEKGYKLGKFKPRSAAALWEMPEPPIDIATNEEARWKYKKARTEAENAKRKYLQSLHVKTTITLETASKFESREKFYLPWSYDYRGRIYPIPPFLSIQDTDFGKSLIKFYRQSFMTPESEEWLKFACATTYGLDKKTMSERMQWVDENHALITRVATDPLDNIGDWEGADEPWQFLAACDEYYHCCIECDRDWTSLPIAVDATCSGMQILAGLAKDADTARLVNVLPSDRPQDAYKTVAEAMIPLLDDEDKHLAEHIDRSVTKRSVMTIPYNATNDSSAKYIRKALKDKKIEIDGKCAFRLAVKLREAMDVVAPGPLRVMNWIKKEMGNAIARGNGHIQWTTPSGFVVHQKRDKWKTKRLNLKLLGRCVFSVLDEPLGPDKRKHQSCGAPNLIHSLDASLLHLTFQRFDVPFSVIHDSVLCRATDMHTLSAMIRETYMSIFADQDYLREWGRQIGAETDPPMIDTLEAESVIESTYFFC